jgi:hypothetical protein
MFNPWAYSILSLALVAAVLAWHVPRAAAWVGLAMISFVASSLWWDYGDRQSHALFAFTCDALLVLIISGLLRERWELVVCGAFLASTGVSLVRLAGVIPQGWVYASCLEFLNFVALISICGMGTMDRIARHAGHPPDIVLRGLLRARHSL